MVPRHFESRLPPLRLLVKAESHTQELGVRVKLKQPSPALNLMSSNRGKRSTRKTIRLQVRIRGSAGEGFLFDQLR